MESDNSPGPPGQDRRASQRVKIRVPVELRPQASPFPVFGETSDISLSGCYVEMMFTFDNGTELEIILKIGSTLLALGTVVTCDSNVGNGIEFTKILPEDIEELKQYLESVLPEPG